MNHVKITRGDKVTMCYQLREAGVAKDISGMSFRFAVKENTNDTAYKIGPVDGTLDDAGSGKFSFDLSATETGQAPFAGVYEIVMYDSSGERTTITPGGGLPFRIIESIID